jgi:hypothetical protein
MSKGKLLAGFAGAALPCLLAFATAAQSDEVYSVFRVIPVPGGLTSFDIAFVDANINTFVLADRTNKSVDVVDTNSNVMTHQYTASPPFRGVFNPLGLAGASGPNGVIIVDQREVWATDAPILTCTPAPQVCTVVTPSSVKVIDLVSGITTHTIDTGGVRRTDELCEHVKGETVLVANDNELDNFLTFINTETYSVIGTKHKLDGTDANFKITLTGVSVPAGAKVAAVGIEQCKFNPRMNAYYLAIPATSIIPVSGSPTTPGPGVVLKIGIHPNFHIQQTITVPTSTGCTGPAGLAIGPAHQILLGCGGTNSLVIDDRSVGTATIIKTQLTEGGADEVWYNPGDNSYFIARSSVGKLGVSDAAGTTEQDADVTTTIGSHVVAADMTRNQIYVPVRSNTVTGTCTVAGCATLCGAAGSTAAAQGCIAVLTAPNDDKCLAKGMPVLDHDDGDDPVFMRTRCRDDDDAP